MDDLIWVRATVSLPGLALGRKALVNPADPYIAECLARGYLLRLPTSRPSEPEVATDG